MIPRKPCLPDTTGYELTEAEIALTGPGQMGKWRQAPIHDQEAV